MDGASTRLLEEQQGRSFSGEALFRSSLNYFYILGNGPVGKIDMYAYKKELNHMKKRALTDENFMQEVVKAQKSRPSRATNGMTLLDRKGKETDWLVNEIWRRSGTGSKVLLLVLDPSGRDVFRFVP